MKTWGERASNVGVNETETGIKGKRGRRDDNAGERRLLGNKGETVAAKGKRENRRRGNGRG